MGDSHIIDSPLEASVSTRLMKVYCVVEGKQKNICEDCKVSLTERVE